MASLRSRRSATPSNSGGGGQNGPIIAGETADDVLIDDDDDAETGELEDPELTPTRASKEPRGLNKVQKDTLETGELDYEEC